MWRDCFWHKVRHCYGVSWRRMLRSKPIFFLDISDPIAMQEAEMFSLRHSQSDRIIMSPAFATRLQTS